MKKIISILVSVIMILTALPVFADGETTVIPASVDIYEALDNFSADELATTYTSSAPYTTASEFKAPASVYMDATIMEDETVGKYFRLVPSDGFASASDDYRGGVSFCDSENIRIGTTNKVFTTSVTLRQNIQTNLYWYFYKADGKTLREYPLRWWGSTGLYSTMSGNWLGSNKTPLAVDTWYTITYTMDLNNKTIRVVVDGGNYDNVTWTGTLNDTKCSTIISNEPVGVGIGYFGSVTSANCLDIASMSFSTSGSLACDDRLTFENGTYASSMQAATAWTSGQWSTTQSIFTDWQQHASIENVGLPHGNALKLMRTDNNGANYEIRYTVPSGMVASNDTVVIETSYKAHNQGQPRIYVQGTGGGTNYLLTFEDGSVLAGIILGDTENKVHIPAAGQWMRLRFIFDLENDKLTFSIWPENNPADITTVVKSGEKMANYSDLTSIRFYPYNKTWGNSDYKMYMDDFKVYKSDTLRYMGSNPVNGGANAVSVTADPSLIFNMPVENYTGTMTLKDSDGNAVAGTVGLNAQRNGVAYYPTVDLKGEETYTLDFEGTVTDTFGQTLAVDKTITFTTEPVLTLVNFEFSKEEVTAGDLGATIEVKSEDKISKNIYAAIAIYNKVTNELVSIDTDSINAVTKTFELTANVPNDGNAYYAKAFVWNTDTTAAPYFAAETLGLND